MRGVFNPLTSKRRVFFLEFYPDSQSYNCDDFLKIVTSFPEYAYILHDMDVKAETGELKKPHYHIVIRTKPSLLQTILNKFHGLTANFVEVNHDFKWCIRYLLHLDDPDKFQYSADDIVTNLADIGMYIRVQPEYAFVNEMMTLRLDGKSWHDIFIYSCQHSCYDIFRRNLGIIQLCCNEFDNVDRFSEIPDIDFDSL